MLLENKKILIFEDKIENITVQKAAMESEGAQVALFVGGRLSDLERHLPLDLIVMDLMIPGGVDGFDYFGMLHKDPRFASIPIVAVSAMDASLAVSKTKAAGFNGFIAKPVDLDHFAQQLANIISGTPVWDTNRR